MHTTLNFIGSKAHASRVLRRLVFGWPGWLVYVWVIAPFVWKGMQNENFVPLGMVVLLIAFGLHIAHRFITRMLEDDQMMVSPSAPIESKLSTELAHTLLHKRTADAGDLLEASLETERGTFLLSEMNISKQQMLDACREEVATTIDVREFLEYAQSILNDRKETRIDANIVLYLLFLHVPSCMELLNTADMSQEDLEGLMKWEAFHHRFRVKENALDPASISRNGSLGRSWVMGYTDLLDSVTDEVNTTQSLTGEHSVVIHRPAIESVLRVLSRSTQKNVLVLGKVGVGKRRLVENVAIALRKLERDNHQPFTRILMLKTEELLSGGHQPDAFLLSAMSRATSGRFVLVIKDFALLLKSANENLKAVLTKFLEEKNISVIGIADTQDYHTVIKSDPLLDNLFEKVAVEDADDDETVKVLMAHYFTLESRKVRITYKALKSIMELSRRYLASRGGFPGKAIEVMDDAILRAHEKSDALVRDEHVRDVISLKGRVNVQRVNEGEKEKLLKMEETMRTQVIGQDTAIKAVVGALKRARIDLSDRKKPIGTFLFLGPTGVGKTQTAKVLAEQYFGSTDAMIRLDMNEYSHPDSVFNIIGSSNGGGSEGFLAQRVQDKPFSLVLLDEIEKAHKSVLNLFLQILDEGFLNDAKGNRTDFRNTIIIATSNAGSLFIRDFVRAHEEFDKVRFKSDLIDTILKQELFTPEFVNRFDEIVLYYPLSEEVAVEVGKLMLGDIIAEIKKRRGISIVVEEDVVAALVDRGYSMEFGAREMRRTITDVIEDYLADYLLRHDVKRGEEIVIQRGDLKW